MTGPAGTLLFLTRSETRLRTMRRLAAAAPCQRETLANNLGVSKRTVKRTLDEFDSRQWVTKTQSGYVLTALGHHVLETYESATATLAAGDRIKPVLKHIQGDRSGIPIESFRDADIVEATENDPNGPIDRILALQESTHRLRELSPIVTKGSVGQLSQRVEASDVDSVEVILERAVVDTIEGGLGYRELFEQTVEADAVSVFVYDGSFPFLIVLGEQRVALAVTDDAGHLSAVAITDTLEAYEWAEHTYEQFRHAATRLSRSRILPDSTGSVELDSEYH